jgi:thymidine kinase
MEEQLSRLNRIPEFIIFTGPMFGSKTTRLLAAVDRFRYQSRKIIAFKPCIDERYSKSEICTHNGGKIEAQSVKTGKDIFTKVTSSQDTIDVIAVDEAFMIPGSAKYLLDLFRAGYTIVVSSLQLSATGNVFEEIRDMMPWATKIEVCPAVCTITGLDAFYTHKKFNNMKEITVGGSDLYEPRCWFHHESINKSMEV